MLVYCHMFGSLVLNRVRSEVHDTTLSWKTTAVWDRRHDSSRRRLRSQTTFAQTLATFVLGFNTRPRNNVLMLRRPRDKVIPETDTKHRSGTTSLRTINSINTRIRNQTIEMRRTYVKTTRHDTLKVARNTLESKEMRFTRIMHIKTYLLSRICNIWTSGSKILTKTTCLLWAKMGWPWGCCWTEKADWADYMGRDGWRWDVGLGGVNIGWA